MGFRVDFDELTVLGFSVNGKTGGWGEQLVGVQEALSRFVGMGSFQGAGAQNAKDYLSEVHAAIIVSFGEILAELGARFLLFKDGYYQIESDPHAQLSEDALTGLERFYAANRDGFEDTHVRIRNTVNAVSDIVWLSVPSSSSVSGGHATVLRDVSRLRTRVVEYETQHASKDFIYFDKLVAALKRFMSECQARSVSLGGYEPGSWMNSVAAQHLGQVLSEAYGEREALTAMVEAAGVREQERFVVLEAEWAKERQEQGWLKFAMGALVVVGGVVCIVATAGMATPFVVAGASATIAVGASNMVQGVSDVYLGVKGDYSSESFNPLRDTVFAAMFGDEGKQQAYDTFSVVVITASSVLSLGAGGVAAYGQGAARVEALGVCQSAVAAGGRKAVYEYGAKVVVGMSAGTLSGYTGKSIALNAGASESVAELIGLGSGMLGGAIGGAAMNKTQWSYKPGSRGIPDGVCFIAGTPIHTPDGLVPIESIQPGNLVTSTNPETGDTTYQPVLNTFIRESTILVRLTINGCDTLVTTEHPYWIPEHGWVHAQNLKPGDLLHGPSGDRVPVEHVTREQHDIPITVYNMEIGDYHTYYAGQTPVLVHNAGQNYKPLPESGARLPKTLRTKLNKIEGLSRKGGPTQVTGRVTPQEARQMAEQFVGPNYTETRLPNGAWKIRSADGLRQVRGPSPKRTDKGRNIHPISKQPHSSTGVVANFESRPSLEHGFSSNVHVDIKGQY